MALTVPPTVGSSGGVQLAVHDLAPSSVAARVVLVSHATGFHGRCYLPMAHHLATDKIGRAHV